MNNVLLSINNLSVGYHQEILSNIFLTADRGEVIGLIGRNGSGKSTFLKTLVGILPALKGDIHINEASLFSISSNKRAKKISIVLSNRINQPIKVFDFLKMGRYIHKSNFMRNNPLDMKVVKKVSSDLKIEHLFSSLLNELSDGEHQKIMIARALIQDTPVMLFDEPTTHLDLENKALIIRLLKEISKKHQKTIILSTHEINFIITKIDKIWEVRNKTITEIEKKNISSLFCSDMLYYDEDCKIFRLA